MRKAMRNHLNHPFSDNDDQSTQREREEKRMFLREIAENHEIQHFGIVINWVILHGKKWLSLCCIKRGKNGFSMQQRHNFFFYKTAFSGLHRAWMSYN